METRDFFAMTRKDLEAVCLDVGVPQVHAANLYRSAYKSLELVPWVNDSIRRAKFPLALVSVLGETASLGNGRPKVVEANRSTYDNSVKFLVELSDGERVETVLMPESKRLTLCLSSQVGCRQACSFCHTGRMGLRRNLTAGEIVGQVIAATDYMMSNPEWLASTRLPSTQRITNIVFMGMGEPLDNVPEVSRALEILTDPYGLAIAIRRISVSTAGHLDGLEEMLKLQPNVRFAISVHSTDDKERSRIMPINKRWPLTQLMSRIRELPDQQKHGILLQYTLISGVNDDLSHAHRLVEMTQGINAKINLIPFNKIGPSVFDSPSDEHIQAFRNVIYKSGIRVMVRYSKGQDIAAACGQLVVKH